MVLNAYIEFNRTSVSYFYFLAHVRASYELPQHPVRPGAMHGQNPVRPGAMHAHGPGAMRAKHPVRAGAMRDRRVKGPHEGPPEGGPG